MPTGREMIMNTAIRQPFTPAQVELLSAMANLKNEEELYALKLAISRFFAERADKELERLLEDGTLNDEVIEGWEHEHMRTPYHNK